MHLRLMHDWRLREMEEAGASEGIEVPWPESDVGPRVSTSWHGWW
jgi:hypothetical protein